jgi:hypothetical protein
MPSIHRIQWFDAHVRTGRYPSARSLAERFEISHRQAQRDIEYMRDSLGAPLEYCASRRGYRYIEDTFALPSLVVTAREGATLAALASQYSDIARLAFVSEGRFGARYAEMANVLRRLGEAAVTDEPTESASSDGHDRALHLPQPIPYTARLLPIGRLPGRLSAGLEPYFGSADDDGSLVFTFPDASAFLSALLSAGIAFRVQSPAWLRRRLLAAADELAEANCDRPASDSESAQYDIPCRTAPATLNVSHTSKSLRGGAPGMRNSTGARLTPSWASYVGAAHGVLKAAGMIDLSMGQMMGMTGIGFHFIVHEECCPSSVTVYDWMSEHQQAMARIGVFAELNMAEPGTPTYDAARRHTIHRIRESIDRGVGAILWGVDTGEFGVAYGYDDDDQVLLVSGVASAGGETGESDPILYDNVGLTFGGAPILFCQTPIEAMPFDLDSTSRQSLAFYVEQMEKTTHVAPAYHSGLLAYDAWIRAMKTGKFNPFGLRYIAAVYADAKAHTAEYIESLSKEWDTSREMQDAAGAAKQLAKAFSQILDDLEQPSCGPEALGNPVSPAQAASLIPLLERARALEQRQVGLVKQAIRNTPACPDRR